MGMTRPKRPQVVVVGTVQSVDPRTKKGTDEVFRFDVTVETPSMGMLSVEYWERPNNSPELPPVAQPVVLVAEVTESAQYGASLGFVRYAGPNDLDLILSASGLAGAKA